MEQRGFTSPFEPTSAVNVPECKVSETSSSTTRSPYRTLTPSALRTGSFKRGPLLGSTYRGNHREPPAGSQRQYNLRIENFKSRSLPSIKAARRFHPHISHHISRRFVEDQYQDSRQTLKTNRSTISASAQIQNHRARGPHPAIHVRHRVNQPILSPLLSQAAAITPDSLTKPAVAAVQNRKFNGTSVISQFLNNKARPEPVQKFQFSATGKALRFTCLFVWIHR